MNILHVLGSSVHPAFDSSVAPWALAIAGAVVLLEWLLARSRRRR